MLLCLLFITDVYVDVIYKPNFKLKNAERDTFSSSLYSQQTRICRISQPITCSHGWNLPKELIWGHQQFHLELAQGTEIMHKLIRALVDDTVGSIFVFATNLSDFGLSQYFELDKCLRHNRAAENENAHVTKRKECQSWICRRLTGLYPSK